MDEAQTKLLAKHYEVWDQTIGCSLCRKAWWGDDNTQQLVQFHADTCPLKGREDIFELATFEDETHG